MAPGLTRQQELAASRTRLLSAFSSRDPTPPQPVGIPFDQSVRHRWSPKRILRQLGTAIGFIGIPFVFVLFVYAFARSVVTPPSNMVCSLQQSPPHTRNRSVGRTLCTTHKSNEAELIKQSLGIKDVSDSSATFSFLVVGDFGRDGFCCQRDVAIEMDNIGAAINARFVLNSGDSFYESGIDSVDAEEVRTSWADVYNQTFLRTLEWWGVLGNHDYRGSTQALMDLSTTVAPRFILESRWWTRTVSRGPLAKPVRFIMIDTSPMISNYRTEDPDMRNRSDGIDSQFDRVEEQMVWLKQQLQRPHEIKIVLGHHPAFSFMDYGTENRTFLETRVASLLEEHGTLAYFAGHDHNLQFARPRSNSTAYFVSGAGSRLRDGLDNAGPNDVHFFHVVHGFLAGSILQDNSLRVAAVDMYGKMIDLVSVP